MARYISKFSLPKQSEAVYSEITQKIIDAGYKYTDYEYETVFKKGNNVISVPCFIKLALKDNVLTLEAWNKTGVMAGVFYKELKPNRELKRLITDIEEYITQNEGDIVVVGEVKEPQDEKNYPEVQKPCGKSEFVKKYAPKSLIKEFTASAIMIYILSVFSICIGYLAKDLRILAAFVAIGVLATIMHLLKSTVFANIVAVLGCFSALLYTGAVAFGFNEFIFYNFEARPFVVATIVISALMAALWTAVAVSLFVTAHKVNKFYKKTIE